MNKVADKILSVMRAVSYVQKQSRNEFQGYNYASEAAFLSALRQAMIDNHLIMVPKVLSFEVAPAGQSKSGTPQFLTTILTEYTVIDAESGESLTTVLLGQGHDSGDKGAYKAATGVNKYVLAKLFQIATGDDPEDGEQPTGAKPTPKKQTTRKPATTGGSGNEQPEGFVRMTSRYGSAEKPGHCIFCGEQHIVEDDEIFYNKDGDKGKKTGAVACWQGRENKDDGPPDDPENAPIGDEFWSEIMALEGKVAKKHGVKNVPELRKFRFDRIDIDGLTRAEIRAYRVWLEEMAKVDNLE